MDPYQDDPGYTFAAEADSSDPLAEYCNEFVDHDKTLIYLDGNSLGRLPKQAVPLLHDVIDAQWGERLIRSWAPSWWNLASRIGSSIAPLIGARPGDVVVADSTSVALFKLTVGALSAAPDRTKIVTDNLNFPSDLYVTQAAADITGSRTVVVVESEDDIHGPEEALIAALDGDTALLTLSHVSFKSGYLYDMEKLTAAAHAVGAKVLWDLSHSVGAVPIDLLGCGVDLAVGCTYKYLNGGPGSPAFIYVRADSDVVNPIAGWWGHRDPFAFDQEFGETATIARFQTGTMPILSLAAVEPGVSLTARAGMEAVRRKSIQLSEYFIELSDLRLRPLGYSLATPRSPERRGSHVSLRHPDGWRITQALIAEANVIPDFRAPDNIRFGLCPLYTGFVDIHSTVMRLLGLHATDALSRYPQTRDSVS